MSDVSVNGVQGTGSGVPRAERMDRLRDAMAGVGRMAAGVGASVVSGGSPVSSVMSSIGSGDSGTLAQIQQMNASSQAMQMEYLQIQQQVQDDNRRFSLLTNVMRSQHDTVKAAIQNIRS